MYPTMDIPYNSSDELKFAAKFSFYSKAAAGELTGKKSTPWNQHLKKILLPELE